MTLSSEAFSNSQWTGSQQSLRKGGFSSLSFVTRDCYNCFQTESRKACSWLGCQQPPLQRYLVATIILEWSAVASGLTSIRTLQQLKRSHFVPTYLYPSKYCTNLATVPQIWKILWRSCATQMYSNPLIDQNFPTFSSTVCLSTPFLARLNSFDQLTDEG